MSKGKLGFALVTLGAIAGVVVFTGITTRQTGSRPTPRRNYSRG